MWYSVNTPGAISEFHCTTTGQQTQKEYQMDGCGLVT